MYQYCFSIIDNQFHALTQTNNKKYNFTFKSSIGSTIAYKKTTNATTRYTSSTRRETLTTVVVRSARAILILFLLHRQFLFTGFLRWLPFIVFACRLFRMLLLNQPERPACCHSIYSYILLLNLSCYKYKSDLL